MPRKKAPEPEWDSSDESEDASESGSSESEFDDEDSESESESGSEEYSESEEDSDEDESESGSSEYSSDSGADESIEEVGFGDEGGMWGRESSDGNEPSGKPMWAKAVPAKIMDKGKPIAITFLACVCCVPLILIIGLSVGLTVGRDEKDDKPLVVTPAPFTAPPTEAPEVRATVLTADASNTIYRSGTLAEVSEGERGTMLVQNPPPGDLERPSAYSLVQFEGIVGVDSDAGSVDEYLSSIENLVVDFCLTVAKAETAMTYSTCLLPSDSSPSAIEDLTGATAPSYVIPGDCLNNQVVTFDVGPDTSEVCVDIGPLLSDSTSPTDAAPPALRGLRQMQEENGFNTTYLFIIDTLEETSGPGTRFFSSQDTSGNAPTLSIEGENTCKSFDAVACTQPGFKTLCSLVNKVGVENILSDEQLSSRMTAFAPTDAAFRNLANETLEALNNTDTLIETLRYHISPTFVSSSDIECSSEVEMLNSKGTFALCGTEGKFYQVGTGVSPGVNSFPEIISTDIELCLGNIHVIDQVMIPPGDEPPLCIDEGQGPATIAELCTGADAADFSMLCALLGSASALEFFSSLGLYTMFAPTDDAFNKAFAAFGEAVDFTDVGLVVRVTEVLLQHVVSGSAISAADLACGSELEMANGALNFITCRDGARMIRGHGNKPSAVPEITETDIRGCNFVIHRIDELILPRIVGVTDGEHEPLPKFDSCGICGAGKSIRLPDATIDVPDNLLPAQNGDFTCQMADAYCRAGNCSPETCAAFADGPSGNCGCEDSVTVVDVIGGDPVLSALATFATSAGALDALDAAWDITVFAPDNDAFTTFAELNPELAANFLNEEWKTHLEGFLQYHVLSKRLASSDIATGLTSDTLSGDTLKFLVNKNLRIFVNNKVRVENADAAADNGIVHTIEAVLSPPWINKNILEVIGSMSNLSTLTGFVTVAQMINAISGEGPFTVFAPTNEAIQKTLETYANVIGDEVLANSEIVKMILEQHIVPGIHPASAASDGVELTSLSDGKLTFSQEGETTSVNGIEIVSSDILANNGIIHTIDGLLIPPSILPPATGGVGAPGGPTNSPPELPTGGVTDGAATQSCSICSGEAGQFKLNNGDATITIPEGVTISTIQATETTCTLAEQACQFGYCDAASCLALAVATKETCGCESL